MPKAMSNAQLAREFDELNKSKFHGVLPRINISFADIEGYQGLFLKWPEKGKLATYTIEINSLFVSHPRLVRYILLHEMVHWYCERQAFFVVDNDPDSHFWSTHWKHGAAFQRFMLSLARSGHLKDLW